MWSGSGELAPKGEIGGVQVLAPAGTSHTINLYVSNQTPSDLVEVIQRSLDARGAIGQSEQVKKGGRQALERSKHIFTGFDLPECLSKLPQRFIHDTGLVIRLLQARSGSSSRAEEDHVTHDRILQMRAVQQSITRAGRDQIYCRSSLPWIAEEPVRQPHALAS